jgi:N-acetylglucosaminyldiphosphoundecaprenol N-acetyl-beta-D-mannosaminyltransferase
MRGRALESVRAKEAPWGAVVGADTLGARQWARISAAETTRPAPAALPPDDLAREVYCLLGMPVDAIDMATALARIEAAAAGTEPFLVSTCNLNFLAQSLSDPTFRASLLGSDLVTADGMPILWLARLLGIPVKARVAGSDMFAALASRPSWMRRLTVFLFGGGEGVAEAAGRRLNAQGRGLECAGALYPGYGSVAELSSQACIDTINASGAGFLAVSLGACKGQAWLRHNHRRLTIPVRAHLGAAIGFQAGVIRRAPLPVQKLGLEWLWRIKEEPQLWRRYWHDGCVLLRLLLTRVLPQVARSLRTRASAPHPHPGLGITSRQERDAITLLLEGSAVEHCIAGAIAHFRIALAANKRRLVVDLSRVIAVDQRFLGLLLMLRKSLEQRLGRIEVVGASPAIERAFRLNEAAFLLSPSGDAPC